MPQPTPIALDSNALKLLFQDYGLAVLDSVKRGRLRVYVPVIVYAEQAIYPKQAIDDVCEALGAQVVSLDIRHARRLGQVWRALPEPFPTLPKKLLWNQHKFDLLIAITALEENWLLITQDKGPAFQIPDLKVLTVAEFAAQYLTEATQ